jgi:hypothetical protein
MKTKIQASTKYLLPVVSLLLLTTVVLFSSCGLFLAKLTGNIKNPKLENGKTIKLYSEKYKDPYDLLWMADSKLHFEEIIQRFTSIPEVLIYDRNFAVLQNAHGEECKKLLISFFTDSLAHEYIKINDSSFKFIKARTKVVDYKATSANYDYTIIYLWTKWTPKFSKDIFERLAKIKNNGKYNICFISLNKDWQEGMYEEAPKINNKVHNGGRALARKK